MLREAGDALQQLHNDGAARRLVHKNGRHDLADHFAVPEVLAASRHADEYEIERVRELDKPSVDILHEEADIKQNEPDLAGFRQAADVAALKFYIVLDVDKEVMTISLPKNWSL
jgi:hypothetical protein